MKTTRLQLIDELTSKTKEIKTVAETFKSLSVEDLNWRSAPESWNILECLEHLNLYGDFYLPEIKKRLDKPIKNPGNAFKSGYLGEKFVQSMLPDAKTGKLQKMNTFKSKNPVNSILDIGTIDRFLSQQAILLDLLDRSRETDLNRIRTNITIARGIIKLKLGDTLRFIVYHNYRHIQQALRVSGEKKKSRR